MSPAHSGGQGSKTCNCGDEGGGEVGKIIIGKISNVGKIGKIGKISNFGAVGDGSVKGNVGKVGEIIIGKISNFGVVASKIVYLTTFTYSIQE
ncbi:MAG: hypothetical protein MJE68_18515 [Proteobacteria bacterium]|nr:hypothetical protein [Pseudomonadota bacterium]